MAIQLLEWEKDLNPTSFYKEDQVMSLSDF